MWYIHFWLVYFSALNHQMTHDISGELKANNLKYSKNCRIQEHRYHFRASGWLGSYISGILGEISLKRRRSLQKVYFFVITNKKFILS